MPNVGTLEPPPEPRKTIKVRRLRREPEQGVSYSVRNSLPPNGKLKRAWDPSGIHPYLN